MAKYFFLICFFFLAIKSHAQYHPIYSQYMFNGLILNPAYAGNNGYLTGVFQFRNQWTQFKGAPTTQSLAFDSPLKNPKFNFGLLMTHDQYGISNKVDIAPNFAVRLPMAAGKISAGISSGISFLNNNWANIVTNTEDDVFSGNTYNTIAPIIGMGLFYQERKFYIGASIPQIIFFKDPRLNQIYYSGKMYYVTSGYNYKVNDNFDLKPSFLLRIMEGGPLNGDVNIMTTYKDLISFGTSYRVNNAFVFLLEYRKDKLRVGYAYDHILNPLRGLSTASHEIILKYEFRYSVKVMDPRSFR